MTDRWSTAAGEALADEVVRRLMAGRSLDGLDLNRHDGLIDLRGLPARIPPRRRRFKAAGRLVEQLGDEVIFGGVELSTLDLSGAHLQSLRFHDCAVVGCRFDGARCGDWRLWGTEVTNCSFTTADLGGAAVGTWHDRRRNTWRHVSFAGADFRVGVSLGARYEDCDFTMSNLAEVHFEQCSLIRCRFSGPMREVIFDGRELDGRPAPQPMEDVDFSEARFEDVEFMGLDLSRVTLPNDPDVRLIRRYRCVVAHALSALEGDESLAARMLRGEFENRLHMMRAGRGEEEDTVFNRRDYAAVGDAFLALAIEVFAEAEARCRP